MIEAQDALLCDKLHNFVIVTIEIEKALKAGEILDGEGGYCVAGQLRPTRISVPMNALPLGLTGGVKLLRDVPADTILTYDDVEIDETLEAVQLRRECEAMVGS